MYRFQLFSEIKILYIGTGSSCRYRSERVEWEDFKLISGQNRPSLHNGNY